MVRYLEELDKGELANLGFGKYGVEEVIHCTCCMPDGVKLALRIWGPKGFLGNTRDVGKPSCILEGESSSMDPSFPAVLEYLPYRKADWTSERDHRRHPWLASHGYVVVRADIRGSGDSQGVYYDEYTRQEQLDACSLIQWITDQSWSSGKVGMYGKSWGGFNGLQVAFNQPPGLAAVISLFSTDNRFEDDIHYKGGCVLSSGMLSWASVMFCWDARPPHPSYDPDWQQTWLNRLETAGESCARQWLEHQKYDHYWKHGSICEDYQKVNIPVLVIGGWHDGYTNAALRMAELLPMSKTIVGPWSHNWPDEAVPGPNIGFMDECLAWWDQHLKGIARGCDQQKNVRWYNCKGVVPPAPGVSVWPGTWHHGNVAAGQNTLTYSLADNNKLLSTPTNVMQPKILSFNGNSGLGCGEWLSFGAPDLPLDQRYFNSFAATWTSDPLLEDVIIFGRPSITAKIRSQNKHAQLFASLSHVFPSGQTRLLTYGVLNLGTLEEFRELKVNTEYSATVEMDAIGYTVPAGASFQVLLSPGSWPTVWPSPDPSPAISLLDGQLILRTDRSSDSSCFEAAVPEQLFQHPPPRLGPPKRVEVLRPASFDRKVEMGTSNCRRIVTMTADDGRRYITDVDTELEEVDVDRYTIFGDDPLSVESYCERVATIVYSASTHQPITTETHTESWLTCDASNFYLTQSLKTKLNGRDFFSKTWKNTLPRNYV